ncbi:MAG: hypothetical protein OYH77_04870 [Pseudomonadota bacterium]|nr:hypothetical protein [Pseudomonadota bacterium]
MSMLGSFATKAVAVFLVLSISGLALAQDPVPQSNNKVYKTAAVVAGVALIAIGGGTLVKHINTKAAEAKAVAAATEAIRLKDARKSRRREARQLERQAQRQQSRQLERQTQRQQERKEVRRLERQTQRRQERKERIAAEIREVEANTANLIKQHRATIERSEMLAQRARDGDTLTVDELRTIHEGRMATLEIEQAKEIAAIYKKHPEYHPPAEVAAAKERRDEQLANTSMFDNGIRRRIQEEFANKYPKHLAIENVEKEYQPKIEYQQKVYKLAKDLTDGAPKITYESEFSRELAAIISETSIADELDGLVAHGNLQEVVWRLEESGFSSEADRITAIIEDTLMNGEIVNRDELALKQGATKPLLVEFKNGLKGVFKGDYGQYQQWPSYADWPQREIAAHRLDKLFGLNVFPITVPRKLTANEGAIQLFIDGAGKDYRNQYIAYHELIGKELYHNKATDRTKNFTFFKLTADRDGDAYFFNNIHPVVGRTVKIDAEQAFYQTYESAGESLLKRPEEFYTDPDFIAHLDSITVAELEEVFQPLFSSEHASAIAAGTHEDIRSYVDAVRELNLNAQ